MVLNWMHWMGFGLMLMLVELAIGSFFIFLVRTRRPARPAW
jgi:hypothetical protein